MIKNILRAAFVLPFTAGSIKCRRNGEFSSHDANISGVILLSSAVAILAVLLIMLGQHSSSRSVLMISLLLCGIVYLLVCFALLHFWRDWICERHSRLKPSENLQLKFLWVFCISNGAFLLAKSVYLYFCDPQNDTKESYLYYACTIFFQVIQTTFIQKYSRYKLSNTVFLYYCLFFVFLVNISLWTQRTIDLYYNDFVHFSTNHSTLSCYTNKDSKLSDVINYVRPFLDPILLEYCLLSVIFISKMWPKTENTDTVLSDFSSSTMFENSSESRGLLSGRISERGSISRRRSIIAVTFIGVVYIIGYSTIHRLPMYILVPNAFITMTTIVYLAGDITQWFLLIKCFYAFCFELRPKMKNRNVFNLKARILVISTVASCGYHVMRMFFFPCSAIQVALTLFRVLAVVLQTILIVQMRLYRKFYRTDSIVSVDSTFLFLCLVNFAQWMAYTFITFENELRTDEYQLIYDVQNMLKLVHFGIPFVIFYHFECFVSFYHFFRQ